MQDGKADEASPKGFILIILILALYSLGVVVASYGRVIPWLGVPLYAEDYILGIITVITIAVASWKVSLAVLGGYSASSHYIKSIDYLWYISGFLGLILAFDQAAHQPLQSRLRQIEDHIFRLHHGLRQECFRDVNGNEGACGLIDNFLSLEPHEISSSLADGSAYLGEDSILAQLDVAWDVKGSLFAKYAVSEVAFYLEEHQKASTRSASSLREVTIYWLLILPAILGVRVAKTSIEVADARKSKK